MPCRAPNRLCWPKWRGPGNRWLMCFPTASGSPISNRCSASWPPIFRCSPCPPGTACPMTGFRPGPIPRRAGCRRLPALSPMRKSRIRQSFSSPSTRCCRSCRRAKSSPRSAFPPAPARSSTWTRSSIVSPMPASSGFRPSGPLANMRCAAAFSTCSCRARTMASASISSAIRWKPSAPSMPQASAPSARSSRSSSTP